MPQGILAEAKFSTWDGGIVAGTVYEVMEAIPNGDKIDLYFYDDNLVPVCISYYLKGKDVVYNNDMFQLYFQF